MKKIFCNILICFASFFEAAGQPVSVADSLRRAIEVAKSDTFKVSMFLRLSAVYNDSNVLNALTYAGNALDLSEKLNWTTGKMLAEFEIGECYPQVGEYDEAIRHYDNCIRYAQEIGRSDIEVKTLVKIDEAYNSAGNAYESIKYKEKAITLAHVIGDKWQEYNELNNLAGAYFGLHQNEKSIACWKKCLLLTNAADNKIASSVILNNLAGAYLEINRADSALAALREAASIIAQWKNRYSEALIYTTFCDYYTRNGRLDSAIIYGGRGLSIARAIHNNDEILQVLKFIGRAYELARQPTLALASYKLYDNLRDSIRNEERQLESAKQVLKNDFGRQISVYEMEKQASGRVEANQRKALIAIATALMVVIVLGTIIYLDLVQRRRQNKIITGQSDKLKQQNQTIEQSLLEKEVLLKEIHHRVKNNLQVISSLLRLQAGSLQDEAARNALLEGQNRVLSMALIHQKLYQDEHIDKVEFAAFADELFGQLRGVFGQGANVAFINELKDTFLGINTAMPLGLILNELITNSFKYAFGNVAAPFIRISMESSDECYTLRYADNGPGLPADVDMGRVTSLGLRLVSRLSRQLNGSARYVKDTNCNFLISFAKK